MSTIRNLSMSPSKSSYWSNKSRKKISSSKQSSYNWKNPKKKIVSSSTKTQYYRNKSRLLKIALFIWKNKSLRPFSSTKSHSRKSGNSKHSTLQESASLIKIQWDLNIPQEPFTLQGADTRHNSKSQATRMKEEKKHTLIVDFKIITKVTIKKVSRGQGD